MPNLITANPPKTSAIAIINPLSIFMELASFVYYLKYQTLLFYGLLLRDKATQYFQYYIELQ